MDIAEITTKWKSKKENKVKHFFFLNWRFWFFYPKNLKRQGYWVSATTEDAVLPHLQQCWGLNPEPWVCQTSRIALKLHPALCYCRAVTWSACSFVSKLHWNNYNSSISKVALEMSNFASIRQNTIALCSQKAPSEGNGQFWTVWLYLGTLWTGLVLIWIHCLQTCFFLGNRDPVPLKCHWQLWAKVQGTRCSHTLCKAWPCLYGVEEVSM